MIIIIIIFVDVAAAKHRRAQTRGRVSFSTGKERTAEQRENDYIIIHIILPIYVYPGKLICPKGLSAGSPERAVSYRVRIHSPSTRPVPPPSKFYSRTRRTQKTTAVTTDAYGISRVVYCRARARARARVIPGHNKPNFPVLGTAIYPSPGGRMAPPPTVVVSSRNIVIRRR